MQKMCHAVWRPAARRLLSGKGRVAMTVNRMNNRMGRPGNRTGSSGEVISVDEGKDLAGLGGDKRRCHVRAISIHLRRNCWLSQDRMPLASCVFRYRPASLFVSQSRKSVKLPVLPVGWSPTSLHTSLARHYISF